MRYKSFRIQNFKGIKDTTIDFSSAAGANVFAFVGLNESGKTTILEAIHSFSPDAATGELLGGDNGTTFTSRVPRHQISTFTGTVSVVATVNVTEADREKIADELSGMGIFINKSSIPDEFSMERLQRFSSGDFKKSEFHIGVEVEVKTGKQRRWRRPSDDENEKIEWAIYSQTPDIAYFPTFIFDFPKRIYLTKRGGRIDAFYRRVFQDILDYDGRGHNIESDIVRRVRSEDRIIPWMDFFSLWTGHDDRNKIEHVMDRAAAATTNLIFGRWNRIFGEDSRGKEILINFDVSEGEVKDKAGAITKTEKHDIFITFQVKDGTRRFNVNDRSLGFRWFFAFMLFTQFRVARADTRPLLFLFDEPASNLHAAAQQKLIESFPEVAKGEHCLVYSTHSHYMIEPKWLEQTFIVTNRSDAPTPSVLDAISLDDESLDIAVEKYRSFAIRHPNQTTYFQPILDRLDVVPSRFDFQRPSVVLEGKSDYYMLRYAQSFLRKEGVFMIPGVGAGTFGALAALCTGWNLNTIFLLDADPAGLREKARYSRDYGLLSSRIVTLSELCADVIQIEDLLNEEALLLIKNELGLQSSPTKSQISRFFQECLASDRFVDMGSRFNQKAEVILASLALRLENVGGANTPQ